MNFPNSAGKGVSGLTLCRDRRASVPCAHGEAASPLRCGPGATKPQKQARKPQGRTPQIPPLVSQALNKKPTRGEVKHSTRHPQAMN